MQIDPMAEKYYGLTPYGYCHSNPLNYIDPSGAIDWKLTFRGLLNAISGGAQLYLIASVDVGTDGAALPATMLWAVESAGNFGLGVTYIILGICIDDDSMTSEEVNNIITSPSDAVIAAVANSIGIEDEGVRRGFSFAKILLAEKNGDFTKLIEVLSSTSALLDLMVSEPDNNKNTTDDQDSENVNSEDSSSSQSRENSETSTWKYYEMWIKGVKDYTNVLR